MKKILLIISILFLIGCNLLNTPSNKVEAYLNNFINISEEVLMDIEKSALNENLNNDNKEKYKNLLSKQYENINYEIKDESIDGNTAIVTVKINVYDFHKTERESLNYLANNQYEFADSDGIFSNDLFNTYRINKLLSSDDRIDYEIKFFLDKKDDEWILRNPDRETLEKINGFYNYDEN